MIIGNVDIGGTAVAFAGTEVVIVDRALIRKSGFPLFAARDYRTTKFLAGSGPVRADAGKLHFQTGRTQRQSVWPHGFVRLLIAAVQRNERFGFEFFDDVVVEFAVGIFGVVVIGVGLDRLGIGHDHVQRGDVFCDQKLTGCMKQSFDFRVVGVGKEARKSASYFFRNEHESISA